MPPSGASGGPVHRRVVASHPGRARAKRRCVRARRPRAGQQPRAGQPGVVRPNDSASASAVCRVLVLDAVSALGGCPLAATGARPSPRERDARAQPRSGSPELSCCQQRTRAARHGVRVAASSRWSARVGGEERRRRRGHNVRAGQQVSQQCWRAGRSAGPYAPGLCRGARSGRKAAQDARARQHRGGRRQGQGTPVALLAPLCARALPAVALAGFEAPKPPLHPPSLLPFLSLLPAAGHSDAALACPWGVQGPGRPARPALCS